MEPDRSSHGCSRLPRARGLVTAGKACGSPGSRSTRCRRLARPARSASDDPERIGDSEAVGLFLERARAGRPDYGPTPDDALASRRRSASGWTACRSPSSWRPRVSRAVAAGDRGPAGAPASLSSRGRPRPAGRASRRCGAPSAGATTCSTPPNSGCSRASRCSRGARTWSRSMGCAATRDMDYPPTVCPRSWTRASCGAATRGRAAVRDARDDPRVRRGSNSEKTGTQPDVRTSARAPFPRTGAGDRRVGRNRGPGGPRTVAGTSSRRPAGGPHVGRSRPAIPDRGGDVRRACGGSGRSAAISSKASTSSSGSSPRSGRRRRRAAARGAGSARRGRLLAGRPGPRARVLPGGGGRVRRRQGDPGALARALYDVSFTYMFQVRTPRRGSDPR